MEIFDPNDTICAISTPPGCGGIAVARISGKDALAITDKIWKGKPLSAAQTHTAHLGEIIDYDGSALDQGVATVFRGPRSYTGDDTVEISVHGSRWIQRRLIGLLVGNGARIALPGEFTRRAFTSGRLDLAEAEAVADLIASSSKAAHRIAMRQMKGAVSQRLSELREQLLDLTSLLELELDFSEEEVEFASREKLLEIASKIRAEISRLHRSFNSGSAIKEGIPVAIVGETNAGKSSLLNALVGDSKAIVSDVHGTTRDIIEDTIEIDEYLFRFMDTAGLRQTSDVVENIGIGRSREAATKASAIIIVVDSGADMRAQISNIMPYLSETDTTIPLIVALNKTDLLPPSASTSAGLKNGNKVTPSLRGEFDGLAASRILSEISGFKSVVTVNISAKTGAGLDELQAELVGIARHLADSDGENDILITNARHAEALQNALVSIDRVIAALGAQLSGELVAQDLRETLSHLSSITGEIPSTEILNTIFSSFCIGK